MRTKTLSQIEADYSDFCSRSSEFTYDFGSWLPSLGQRVRKLYPGEFFVIMGETGNLKTASLQEIALSATNLNTLLFEMELPDTLCFERFLAMQTGHSAEFIEEQYVKGKNVAGADGVDRLWICDQSGLTLEDIEEIAEEHEPKIHLLLVDYLTLIRGKGRSRYETVADVAQGLKELAKRLNLIVGSTAMARGNRGGETGYKGELFIHDAKNAGEIEESCGVLLAQWIEHGDEGRLPILNIKLLKATKGDVGWITRAKIDWPTLRISERVAEELAVPFEPETYEEQDDLL